MTATVVFSDLKWTAEHIVLPPLDKLYKLFHLRTVIHVPDINETATGDRFYSILHDNGEVLCNIVVPQEDVHSFRTFQNALLRSRLRMQ